MVLQGEHAYIVNDVHAAGRSDSPRQASQSISRMTPNPVPRARVILEDSGVVVGDDVVDVTAPSATKKFCELLGPEIQTTIAGVRGSGRTAHWLGSGVVVVTEDA